MPANIVRQTTNLGAADTPVSAKTGINGLPRLKIGTPIQPLVSTPSSLKLVLGKKDGSTSAVPKLSREQKSGMSVQDLKVCQSILLKLSSTKKADLFRHPVDPIRDGAPKYVERLLHNVAAFADRHV